jgi:hypothetical protein
MSFDTGELPYVDEHQTRIAASRDLVWTAVRRYVDSSLTIGARNPLTWLPGTVPCTGFEVAREVPKQQLSMTGRHRFARYRLEFELPDVPNGETVSSARTYAEFPGPRAHCVHAGRWPDLPVIVLAPSPWTWPRRARRWCSESASVAKAAGSEVANALLKQ